MSYEDVTDDPIILTHLLYGRNLKELLEEIEPYIRRVDGDDEC